jgi:hypothetical protein
MISNHVNVQSVERKIYFYKADIGVNSSGQLLRFDPLQILQLIDSFPWDQAGKYSESWDGKTTCCWVDSTDVPQKLRFAFVRKSDFPQLEHHGKLLPLSIPSDSGLADQIHVAFFPNNIVGCDFNFYGPRLSRLAEYFSTKAPNLCHQSLMFRPLLRQNVLDEFNRLGKIRMFKLRIRESYAEALRSANQSLADTFRSAASVGQAEEVEIILKPASHSRGWLSSEIFDVIRKLLRMPDLRQEARAFVIKGLDRETRKIVDIDLLSDKLISKRKILQLDNRSRALDKDSAYLGIQSAYEELREELEVASEIYQ